MVVRNALILDAGQVKELPFGDSLNGVSITYDPITYNPVTYDPFANRVEIPLKTIFPLVKDTVGAAGSIADDPVNGLTLSSTSGTEVARFICTKTLPTNWKVVEFATDSDTLPENWRSNGFVVMGASGIFITIVVGSNGVGAPIVRLLKWSAAGNYMTGLAPDIAWEGSSAFFRLIHRGSMIIVYHSYDGQAWSKSGTINETIDLGGPAQFIGPSANKNNTTYVTYYADADIVPQLSGFIGTTGSTPQQLVSMVQPNEIVANYTVAENDLHGNVVNQVNSAVPVTINLNAGLVNKQPSTWIQKGLGKASFVAGAGVTINSAGGLLSTRVQNSSVTLIPNIATANSYYLVGDLAI